MPATPGRVSLLGFGWKGLAFAWALWSLALLAAVGSGLDWVRYFDRWIGADTIVFCSSSALGAHLAHLGTAVFLMLALCAFGVFVLRLCRFDSRDLLEEATLGFAMGYGMIGTAALLLGLRGHWQSLLLKILVIVPGATGAAVIAAGFRRGPIAVQSPSTGRGWTSLALAFIVFVSLLILRYALIPETFYDALVYHLALPARYLRSSGVVGAPTNSFSGIPALPQMISALALVWDPWGISAGVIHWAMLPWCCAALIALGRRLGQPGAGWIAAAIFAGTPVVIGEAFRMSVGLEWAFLQLSCLCACLSLVDDGAGSRIGRAIVAGILLGFTMATKYPAWLVPLAVLALLVADRAGDDHSEARWSSRELTFAALAATACLVPWIVKNVLLYGNPVFPFLQERFAGSAVAAVDWRQLAGASPGSALGWLLHPWRFLKPADDITETIGPVYFALLPLLCVVTLGRRARLLGAFVVATWLPISFLSIETRYFIPHLAVLALLLAFVLDGMNPDDARLYRGAALALAAISALGWFVMDSNRGKLAVFTGRKPFPEYLAHSAVSYPTPPYAAYEFVNENTPKNSRILVYGDGRGNYLDRDSLVSSNDQPSALETWANAEATGQTLATRLRAERVDYIVANLGEISRLHRQPRLSTHGLAVVDEFWRRYTARVFGVMDPGDRWVGVYKILSDSDAAKPHEADDLFGPFRTAPQP